MNRRANNLPPGWKEVPIGEVTIPKVEQCEPTGKGDFCYVDIGSVDNQAKIIVEPKSISIAKAPSRARQLIRTGDVLASMTRPNLNAVALVPKQLEGAIASTGFDVLRSNGAVLSEWLFLVVRSKKFVGEMTDLVQGALYPAVRPTDIRDFLFPLPPLAEQLRIVTRLETLVTRSRRARAALDDVPQLLAQARQSLLAAAFRGDLTKDWRSKNKTSEHAETLITEHTFDLLEPEDRLPKLPDAWAWAALGNYAKCSRGRFSIRPRNDPSYFGGKHPFIQIGDLPREGGWISAHQQTLNERGLAVSKKFDKGTAVIAIVGATIGNTGLLGYPMCMTDSMVGMETGSSVGNRYVELFMRSKKPEIRRTAYSSGGQPNIKLEILNPCPLPLPPSAEQHEIVRRLERAFARLEAAAVAHVAAVTELDRLDQSLLARAFTGQLVSQNPQDEPPTAMLKQITSKEEANERK